MTRCMRQSRKNLKRRKRKRYDEIAYITNFIDTMEEFYKAAEGESNLKRIRESRGLSQSELAEQSGINVRNIQMYEQRVNNIDKAQAQTLYKLSRVLGCDIEDLLESPMM